MFQDTRHQMSSGSTLPGGWVSRVRMTEPRPQRDSGKKQRAGKSKMLNQQRAPEPGSQSTYWV